jgi:hypothetical protein
VHLAKSFGVMNVAERLSAGTRFGDITAKAHLLMQCLQGKRPYLKNRRQLMLCARSPAMLFNV